MNKLSHPWKRLPLTFGAVSTEYRPRTSASRSTRAPQAPPVPPPKEKP